ncbi:MAG: hypothetical protein P9L91_04435 [Candidatus Zophobacter franzmannii]|jgi:hypothetical protein|nr:hypothetical protein [Candidatus Zophobacter franzmannii]
MEKPVELKDSKHIAKRGGTIISKENNLTYNKTKEIPHDKDEE